MMNSCIVIWLENPSFIEAIGSSFELFLHMSVLIIDLLIKVFWRHSHSGYCFTCYIKELAFLIVYYIVISNELPTCLFLCYRIRGPLQRGWWLVKAYSNCPFKDKVELTYLRILLVDNLIIIEFLRASDYKPPWHQTLCKVVQKLLVWQHFIWEEPMERMGEDIFEQVLHYHIHSYTYRNQFWFF